MTERLPLASAIYQVAMSRGYVLRPVNRHLHHLTKQGRVMARGTLEEICEWLVLRISDERLKPYSGLHLRNCGRPPREDRPHMLDAE